MNRKQRLNNSTHNTKRHILLFVVVFLLLVCLCVAPATSASTNQTTSLPSQGSYQDITITPTTSLTPGQAVTAKFTLDLPGGSFGSSDTLTFSSPLVNAKWEIKVFKGKANTNSQNPSTTIMGTSTPKSSFKPSMFSIYYGSDTDVTLFVTFSGKVPENAEGSSINVINAICSSSKVGSYQSPVQMVGEQNNQSPEQKEENTQALVTPTQVPPSSQGTYHDVTILPSTSLNPGQMVTGVFKLDLPAGSIKDSDIFTLSSPLLNAEWEVKVFKGKADKNSQNPATTITGTSTPNSAFKPSMFSIYYGSDTDVTLVVTLSGRVPENAEGSSINVMNALCSSSKVGSYQSPAQKVSGQNNQMPEQKEENTPVPATPTPVSPPPQTLDNQTNQKPEQKDENMSTPITTPSTPISTPSQPTQSLHPFIEYLLNLLGFFR